MSHHCWHGGVPVDRSKGKGRLSGLEADDGGDWFWGHSHFV